MLVPVDDDPTSELAGTDELQELLSVAHEVVLAEFQFGVLLRVMVADC
jgi:hypothetical protein